MPRLTNNMVSWSSYHKRILLASTCAVKHSLPPAILLWLLKRLVLLRRQGNRESTLARSRALLTLFTAAVLMLYRPLKLVLRLLRGEGSIAPDGPGRLPVIGHLLEMGKFAAGGFIWDYFTKRHEEQGGIVRFVMGPECCPLKVFNFTSDPANVEYILKTNFENYGKGRDVEHVFEEFLGKGIFVVDGERWQGQRKTAAAIFSRRNFSDNMTHVFQSHARRLVSVLRSRAKHSTSIDMQKFFFSLTLDAFCEIGFGFPWNSLQGLEAHDSGPDQDAVNDDKQKWARHFDIAQEVIVNRFGYRPFWKLERLLCRWGLLHPAHDEAKLAQSVKFMNTVVQQILEKRCAEPEDELGSDLLSLFLRKTKDREYLRDMVMNFVLAGRDTTACTLTWLFWELARCPQVFAKARNEILNEAAYGPVTNADDVPDLSFETLNRLKYCNACVRETVRLHPPVPSDPKVAFTDDVLPDGTLVSGGDYVFYEPYAMARDPDLWGSDAADWRPERWLEMEREPSTFLNSAFQAGPRICLGKDMALLEAKAVLAQLVLAGLRWEVQPGHSPTYRYPSIVLPMADPGLQLIVRFTDSLDEGPGLVLGHGTGEYVREA